MSEPIPERADIRQLRTQAKELLRALHQGEPLADGQVMADAKLSDAQRLIARKYGFSSWPKLVDQIETPVLVEQFKEAIQFGNAAEIERLLRTKAAIRSRINEPIFGFDAQPILQASSRPEAEKVIPILVQYGADPNVRSKWWAGGFSALDFAKGEAVDVLIGVGARLDVWSAAKHGRIEDLRRLLEEDPTSVNAPGGDGQRPLHVAATAETAELLIEMGADLEVRDIDHEGTPVQYQVNNLPVLRALVRHGAKPDVFAAVALDDAGLLRRLLDEDPRAAEAHVGRAPFVTTNSNGGHIYAYTIGPSKTPFQMAIERGSKAVLEELQRDQPPSRRLVVAAWAEDASLVAEILKANPGLGSHLGDDSRSITHAAQAGKAATVRLLLEAGVDPRSPGMYGGSALHLACWFGHLEIVKLLIGRVPLDMLDSTHGSPPLGWAAHGSQWCRNPSGDYVGVVRALLLAGADPHAAANSGGTPMLAQAGQREDVKAVLREFGAK